MTSMVPAPLGVVAHFNLLERLEPSGPGELFRARDTRLGRTVAVRILPADFAPTADARAALVERATSWTKLSHPNVITLFDAGVHDNQVYLAFEFLNGQSLRAEMAGRPLNVRRAVETAIQISDALATAHSAGFVHGGLSPDSIVITARGHAKIPAFELAAHGGFEHSGGEVKLHDYDSPEEARGQTPDDRSDLYSVGAILFEMLTARRPMHRGAAAPSASNPHVVKELDEVVLKAVAPNPDSRYHAVATFASELRAIVALIDAKGGAGDEEDVPEASSTGIGKVLMVAAVILVLGAVVWFALRP